MANLGFINPKKSKGSLLEIDKALYDGLPAILEPHFQGKWTYKVSQFFDITGNLKERTWTLYKGELHLQMDAGFVPKENRFIVMIMAQPDGESEVRLITQILIDHGARLLKGIDPRKT